MQYESITSVFDREYYVNRLHLLLIGDVIYYEHIPSVVFFNRAE